jgi:hypothetical protein
MLDSPLPYGRIIRNAGGQMLDIIEEDEALAEVREIRERNLGAYVVDAAAIFSALRRLSPSPRDGQYRLTDCVHELIRSGLRVDSYQLYDQDEVQGINTADDLAHAEFILEKRIFRPRRQEEQNLVTFGTGGWRAIIGEGFTMHNVRRLCQALENDITRGCQEKRGVIVGYDRRFFSPSRRSRGRGFRRQQHLRHPVVRGCATPLITGATAHCGSAYDRLSPPVIIRRNERPEGFPRRGRCRWNMKPGRLRSRPTAHRRRSHCLN